MLTKSESIAELAAALSKVQSTIEAAKKDQKNPFYKANYAGLSSVWDACRKALTENGFAVSQTCSTAENGDPAVTTLLMHGPSGQWIQDTASYPVKEKSAQGFGSAYTYGRRYGLAAIIGVVADDDDDGEVAVGRKTSTAEGRGNRLSASEATSRFNPPPPRQHNVVRPGGASTPDSVRQTIVNAPSN